MIPLGLIIKGLAILSAIGGVLWWYHSIGDRAVSQYKSEAFRRQVERQNEKNQHADEIQKQTYERNSSYPVDGDIPADQKLENLFKSLQID